MMTYVLALGVLVLLLSSVTLAACMLSSRLSAREPFHACEARSRFDSPAAERRDQHGIASRPKPPVPQPRVGQAT